MLLEIDLGNFESTPELKPSGNQVTGPQLVLIIIITLTNQIKSGPMINPLVDVEQVVKN